MYVQFYMYTIYELHLNKIYYQIEYQYLLLITNKL